MVILITTFITKFEAKFGDGINVNLFHNFNDETFELNLLSNVMDGKQTRLQVVLFSFSLIELSARDNVNITREITGYCQEGLN